MKIKMKSCKNDLLLVDCPLISIGLLWLLMLIIALNTFKMAAMTTEFVA